MRSRVHHKTPASTDLGRPSASQMRSEAPCVCSAKRAGTYSTKNVTTISECGILATFWADLR